MSLRVWLPLLNDTKNYGLDNIELIDRGSTLITNDGIPGQCHYLNGKTLSYSGFTSLESTDEFSACCWVKFIALPEGSSAYCICVNNSSASSYKFVLGIYSSDGITATFRLNGGNSIGTLELNTWYHLAVCVAGTTGYMYINGELVKTVTTVTQSSCTNLVIGGRSNNTACTSFKGVGAPAYYNDVRIYDHCLSKKEIHEIAKGLIIHYPLDNNGWGGRNLITTMSSGGCTTLAGKYGLNADFGQNVDTYGYFNVSPALELNTAYTLSFDVSNFPDGAKWGWRLWNRVEYEFMVTGNGHYSYTFIPEESKLPSGYSLTKFLFDDGGKTNPSGIVNFTNFKIESGNKATAWAPNYIENFEEPLLIEDTSGYNRPGTAVQAMNVSSDTPRYDISTIWKDSTDFIAMPNFMKIDQTINKITICGWYKTNTMNSTAPNFFNFGANDFIRGRIAGAASLWSYWNINGTRLSATASTPATTDNKWHHYAFSFNNGVIKIYFDGVLKSTTDHSSTGTILKCSRITGWGLGGYNPTGEKFLGQQSDFRVYATALSDEDILELYEGRPGVDKAGNFYVAKLQENTSVAPNITKTSIADVPGAFYEPTGMNLAYNTTPYDYTGKPLSYTPKADTSNSTLGGFKVPYGAELNGKRAQASVTVTWEGFDSSSEAGTFAMRFQGAQMTAAGGQSWSSATGKSNKLAGAFSSAQSLTSLVLGEPSGSKTITVTYTISAVEDQPGDWLGIRADYSNGVGKITLSDLQVALIDSTISDTQKFKISKQNIAANNIYEI